jgi:hypothetical protein
MKRILSKGISASSPQALPGTSTKALRPSLLSGPSRSYPSDAFSVPDDLAMGCPWLAVTYPQYHRSPGMRRCLSVSTLMHGTIRADGKTGVGPRPSGGPPRFQLQDAERSSSATLSAYSLTIVQATFFVMPSPQILRDQRTFVWSCSRMCELPSHFPRIPFIRRYPRSALSADA